MIYVIRYVFIVMNNIICYTRELAEERRLRTKMGVWSSEFGFSRVLPGLPSPYLFLLGRRSENVSTQNMEMRDKVLSRIQKYGPLKSSQIIRDLDDVMSKDVREICQTTESVQGVKVRQCYYWSTSEQLSNLKRDILRRARDDGFDGKITDIIRSFYATRYSSEYVAAVIEQMVEDKILVQENFFTVRPGDDSNEL